MKIAGLAVVCLVCAAGCTRQSDQDIIRRRFDTSVVLKVSVLKSGLVPVDGNPVAMAELDERLDERT